MTSVVKKSFTLSTYGIETTKLTIYCLLLQIPAAAMSKLIWLSFSIRNLELRLLTV